MLFPNSIRDYVGQGHLARGVDRILLIFLVITNLALPCSAAKETLQTDHPWEREIPREKINFITPKEIEAKQDQWELPLILDVREPQFWFEEHIPGAIQFPYETLILNWEDLPRDKNRQIIVYCTGPGCPYALQAAQLLVWHGYTNVKELKDGVEGWKKEGFYTARINPPDWETHIPDRAVKLISASDLKKKIDNKENFLLLDTQSEQVYRQGHIATAISFPTHRIGKEWSILSKDQEIVVYCGGQGCALSRRAAKILIWHGFQKVYELDDGTHAWEAVGLPLEK
jgi:rhodanese-related sulfurtransferase